MAKVEKVLLLLKNMVYESTSPQETLKFAKYYRSKGFKILVILWGPMGVLLAKKDKNRGSPKYDSTVQECIDMKTSFHSLAMLSSTLFIRAWEQGEKLFVSMNSRCYSGKLVLFEAKRPVKAPEIVLTAAYFLSVLLLLYFTKNVQMVY